LLTLVALAGTGVGGGPAGPAEAPHGAPSPKPPVAEAAKAAAKDQTKDQTKAQSKDPPKDQSKDGDKKMAASAGEKTPEGAASPQPTAKERRAAKNAEGERAAAAAALKREEHTPHQPPPLSITALREEIRHSPAHEGQAAATAEREKLEQLAAEINKAREGLRQDTARLEALLEKRAATAPAASAGESSANAGGEPAKKVPTSLDGLAKAMRGMKPEQAAPIMSRLERKMAADVLVRMPATDAGKVLGQCKPEVAAELAAEIASRTPHAELHR
jgi:flagellar motility protein MotE (MotC chaperone)